MERGVDHAQRAQDALLQELVERHARDLADQVAQHVGGDRVVPGRAGRELQRHLGQRVDEALQAAGLLEGLEPRLAVGRVHGGAQLEAVGQPGGVAQQVDHAHRRLGRPGLVGAGLAGDVDAQVLPGRDEAVHRVVQRHQAFFDQHHEGHAGDRLGHRVDADHRVLAHRRAVFERRVAQHRLVHHLALPRHHHLRARQFAGGDVLVMDEAVEAGQALRAHAKRFGFHGHRVSRGLVASWG